MPPFLRLEDEYEEGTVVVKATHPSLAGKINDLFQINFEDNVERKLNKLDKSAVGTACYLLLKELYRPEVVRKKYIYKYLPSRYRSLCIFLLSNVLYI